jgi:hypothetical protein
MMGTDHKLGSDVSGRGSGSSDLELELSFGIALGGGSRTILDCLRWISALVHFWSISYESPKACGSVCIRNSMGVVDTYRGWLWKAELKLSPERGKAWVTSSRDR